MSERTTTRMPQLTGVDRVTELASGLSARGVRGVGGTTDLLDDHFPNFPVLPGVLLLGSLAELAAIVEIGAEEGPDAPHSGDPTRISLQLAGASRVQFRTFVRPGDVLQLEVKRTGERTYRASASVEGKAVMKVNTLRLERIAPVGASDARGQRELAAAGNVVTV